jgi:hypothetical protein
MALWGQGGEMTQAMYTHMNNKNLKNNNNNGPKFPKFVKTYESPHPGI